MGGRVMVIDITKVSKKELLAMLTKTEEATQGFINVAADIDKEFNQYKDRIESMSFWKRIWVVFTGYKSD
jgi:arsenate reductase-like glutaredoxin family protein